MSGVEGGGLDATDACAAPAWDEAARLAALRSYDILDTGREPAFDDLAELAADILEAPIAVVNFIAADRQWFKAEKGIGVDTLPLDVSICRHAILRPGVMVVPDLTRDPRFTGNPLVEAAGGLRFYAGALLETPDGLPLGTVCVLDRAPRPEGISERQARALRTLAGQAMASLELRRSEARLRASEHRFRAAQETSSDGFMLFESVRGADGAITDFTWAFANPAAERLLGLPVTGFAGEKLCEVMPGHRPSGLFDRYVAVVEGGEPWTMEGPYRLDGVDAYVRLVAVRAGDGFAVSFADITERRRAEKALQESERRLRMAFEVSGTGAWDIDLATGIVTESPEVGAMYGLAAGQTNMHVRETRARTHPDDRAAVDAAVKAAIATRGVYAVEHRVLRPDGTVGVVASRGRAIYAADGTPVRAVGVTRDVTAEREAERALRESEARFRQMADALPGILHLTTADGRNLFVNRGFAAYTGLDAAALAGDGWGQVLHPEDAPAAVAAWRAAVAAQAPYEAQYRIRRHDGAWRWHSTRGLPVRGEDGAVLHWVSVALDVHEQREAARSVQASEARLRAVIEAAPVGLVFADAEGRITGANRRLEEILRHPLKRSGGVAAYAADYMARHLDGRPVESGEYPLARVLAGEARADLECEVARGDGTSGYVRYIASAIRGADGALLGGVVASLDIDREKRLTLQLEREVAAAVAEREAALAQLFEAQKLETIGQMTGGVAHDVNNLLTPIVGSLDMLRRRVAGDERMDRLISGALQSAERARVLVQRLLAFARRQTLQPRPVDVGALMGGMRDLIDRSAGPAIRVELIVAEGLPAVLVDPNQLELAVLNLCVNARDAMPDGGRLTIAAWSEHLRAERHGLLPARYVRLAVADTGAGMDEATLKRAVEPFFSTKGVGQGTGLGLSMVHGLAAQSGGVFHLRSAPGAGTVAELWLPVADRAADPVAARAADVVVAAPRRALVLLVDDEELVRMTTAEGLRELGYEVAEAASAAAAIERVRGGLRPDALVTDHMMPGMTGAALARELREGLPGLPVLMVTGYADVGPDQTAGLEVLAKPFREAELAARLARLVGPAPL